jgi:hypothetical protein
LQAGQRRHGLCHGKHFIEIGQEAMFAGLAADVDLKTDLQRRQGVRALGRQALGDLQAIDAVYPVELFGHGARLVALQGADEMPADWVGARAQAGQRVDLGDAFLHVVFAEEALPCGMCGAYGIGVERLGNGQQCDTRSIARSQCASRCDPLTHGLQVGGDYRHNPATFVTNKQGSGTSNQRLGARLEAPLRRPGDIKKSGVIIRWTSRSFWRFPPRTRRRTCTCRPDCRR